MGAEESKEASRTDEVSAAKSFDPQQVDHPVGNSEGGKKGSDRKSDKSVAIVDKKGTEKSAKFVEVKEKKDTSIQPVNPESIDNKKETEDSVKSEPQKDTDSGAEPLASESMVNREATEGGSDKVEMQIGEKVGIMDTEGNVRPETLAGIENEGESAKSDRFPSAEAKELSTGDSIVEQQQKAVTASLPDKPEDLQPQNSAFSLIEKRLLQLLESTDNKRIPLEHLPELYKSNFASKLDYEKLGYAKLMALVSSFPSLSVEKEDGSGRLFVVRPPNDGVEIRAQPSPDELGGSSQPDGEVSDLCAAVEFLWALQRDFRQGQWPASGGKLTNYLKGLDADMDPKFASWASGLLNEGVGIGKMRRRIVSQLTRMHCIEKVKKKFVWKHAEIQAILASHASSRAAHASDLTISALQASTSLKCDDENCRNAGSKEASVSAFRETIQTVQLIDTIEKLEDLKDVYPFKRPDIVDGKEVVAFDCEGVPDNLYLVQLSTLTTTFVFDCVKLDAKVVCDRLRDLLSDTGTTKLFHDLHNDAAALAEIGGVQPLCGTLDTQLAMESLTGDVYMGFNLMLEELGQQQHATTRLMKGRMQNEQLFAQRPLPVDVLQYAVDDVRLLVDAYESLRAMVGDTWDSIQRASDARALSAAKSGGARRICFDVSDSYAISSFELLQEIRPDDMLEPSPLEVSDESSTLLTMLPDDLTDALNEYTHKLSDVVLDKGRRPHAWVGGSRLLLGDDDRLVEPSEISAIVEKLGGFGTDNRAGLERQLHRISAIRNRESEIIGLTLRVGRHVSGNTGIISDLLFGDSSKSILFLGEPGSGKTTVVREVTRLLSERSNVCIVDTSNEIAGDGDIPHPCVGFARRMMVPNLDKQSAVMIECVQNHTPEVMVIDEIGRPTEVEAARTCKNRGVRLIASAHGDLRKLIKNPKLRGLVGGVETVTLGDAQAKAEAQKRAGRPGGSIQKVKAERAGPPTFDILVELSRDAHHEWRIVLNAADAVDSVLLGEAYKAQRRMRDPLTGAIHLDLERV